MCAIVLLEVEQKGQPQDRREHKMKADSKLAAARNVYNAQKSFNRWAFQSAAFRYCEELERDGFEVVGINFDSMADSVLIYGRYSDENYDRNEFDAVKLYLTVNQYGTRYVAKDYKVTSHICKTHR